jgi:hypothetical protein
VAIALVGALALSACASNSSAQPTTVVSVPQSNVVVLTAAPTTPAGGTTVGPATTNGGNPVTAPVTVPPTEPATTAVATTEPPPGPVVTIIQGGFNTKASGSCDIGTCKYVDIQMSGFAKGETLSIMCFSNHGSSGPFVKTADKTGSFHSTTACFFGNVTNVYVTVNDIKSNVVTPWKDW